MLVRVLVFLFMSLWCLVSSANGNDFSTRADVKEFIHKMVVEHHFKKNELVNAFSTVKFHTSAVHCVSVPLEQKPWYTYQRLFVTEWRVREGVNFWRRNREILARAEQKYHVPASLIVATIGVETKYGANVGKYRVIDALSSIAFSHSTRAKFFRYELEQFFLLTREQHLNPLKVMGSYAGAIGQPQFMPDSYRHYAVSFSGKKQIDLTHNEADIIASIANYYHLHGWSYNQPVALKTDLKGSQYVGMADRHNPFGVKQLNLAKYGISDHAAKNLHLIPLQNFFSYEYWIGFHNFNVIKLYNASNLYAMAVFQLSYYISQMKDATV